MFDDPNSPKKPENVPESNAQTPNPQVGSTSVPLQQPLPAAQQPQPAQGQPVPTAQTAAYQNTQQQPTPQPTQTQEVPASYQQQLPNNPQLPPHVYESGHPGTPSRKGLKTVIWALIAIVVVAGLTFGGIKLYHHLSDKYSGSKTNAPADGSDKPSSQPAKSEDTSQKASGSQSTTPTPSSASDGSQSSSQTNSAPTPATNAPATTEQSGSNNGGTVKTPE